MHPWALRLLVAVTAALSATACGSDVPGTRADAGSSTAPATSAPPSTSAPSSTPGPSATSKGPVRAEPSPSPARTTSDGRPGRALLSVPALGLRDLPVLPYRGRTDDAAGTALQDRGVAASPHGPRGGVGPGGVGNYQVTAHRTSSTEAFRDLPTLRQGHRVLVESRGVRYVYEVRRTRETSFRSERSLAEQRAAVPGRPGVEPTRAYITLSTCATPEDHAAGNYWSDELHNPEHRIDKIGVLVDRVG